jgi:hypothetical protein
MCTVQVGESLESVCLGEGGKRKHNWVVLAPNLTDSPALRRLKQHYFAGYATF